jgi:RNA polymerase sigma-70 factor (ECF subfamily)
MFDPVTLYVDERGRLEQFFARRVHDRDLAADLTAETYLHALSGRDRYDGGDDYAAPWLYGIARHVLSQHRRRAHAHDAAMRRAPVDLDIDADQEHDDVERAQALPGLRDTLAPALRQLPEGERQALALRVVGELTYREVAERLGINPPVARMRVSRALQTLAAVVIAAGIDNWPC